ncbi:MAG TPA: SH3 domain-containing protein [Gemmatales bacterium]|nr:SH3 domain-containing protein [Gemmatales bacterium]
MSVLVVWCLSSLMNELESSPPAVNNPSAWIAVLRDYERQHGRDGWSYQELSEARAAVLDPYYSVKAASGWQRTLVSLYLDYYLVILLMIVVTCGSLAWNYSRGQRWGSVLVVNLIWFALMCMALLPIQPGTYPTAVVKYQATLLREGNGLSYPVLVRDQSRIALAAGVEARLLAERSNGWVQIQLSDGSVGWVPTEVVYLVR